MKAAKWVIKQQEDFFCPSMGRNRFFSRLEIPQSRGLIVIDPFSRNIREHKGNVRLVISPIMNNFKFYTDAAYGDLATYMTIYARERSFFRRRNVQGFSMIIFDEFYRFSLFGNIVEIV